MKTTKSPNESVKFIAITRIMILSIIAYFLASEIICGFYLNFTSIVFYTVFLLCFSGLFILSYYVKTQVTTVLYNIGMLTWICIIVHFFGWNTGVQHFIMVLLTLCFFSCYKRNILKILYAIGLCILRISLFFMYQDKITVWHLNIDAESAMQVINTVTIFWCILIIGYVFSKDGQEMEIRLVEYNSILEKQANTDILTGLSNRRKAMEYMQYIISKETACPGFSVCICDIDFFKKVNDQYGHDYGDEVLIAIAKIFKEEISGKDFVARWGGEEFLLLFPECNGDNAYVKLEHIRRRIKDMGLKKDGEEVSISMTFGLTEYDYSNDVDATLKDADEKLYIGKEQGRDRIIF